MARLNAQNSWTWLAVIPLLAAAYGFWQWEIERIEVPPGKFMIKVHKWGRDLPENQIIAPDETYKGVMYESYRTGRYFVNPLFWSVEIHEPVQVPTGKCLILTRKFGAELPQQRLLAGDILARNDFERPFDGDRGIVRDVLLQGTHWINPYAYQFEQADAVEIKVAEVGVRTLKVGKDPRGLKPSPERSNYTVPDGYRGVQERPLAAGTYYVNPYVEEISPVEVRSHRVELTDIEFPSRDGFILKPRVVVEYAVIASMAPEMMIRLTDEGVMHQADETDEQKSQNEILQKVILPHIRGYARLEGSNFDARDFILTTAAEGQPMPTTNAREALQLALLNKVKPRCAELGVDVRAVALADLRPPEALAAQIAERELARVEQERNAAKVKQHKGEQVLASKTALKQQATEKVAAETRLLQAETKSDQLKEVELAKLKQDLSNASLRLEAAAKTAEATLAKGKVDAEVINLQNEAEIAGLKTAVEGFESVGDFAEFQVLKKIGPALTEIFASDEGLFSKIFSDYLIGRASNGRGPTAEAATAGTSANK